MFKISKSGGTECRSVVSRDGGEGMTTNGHRDSFGGGENALELESVDGCTTL